MSLNKLSVALCRVPANLNGQDDVAKWGESSASGIERRGAQPAPRLRTCGSPQRSLADVLALFFGFEMSCAWGAKRSVSNFPRLVNSPPLESQRFSPNRGAASPFLKRRGQVWALPEQGRRPESG
jgi:hypothetical protein